MSEPASNRRNFLKLLGLTTTASLVNSSAFASFNDPKEIKKLNPVQQEFMNRYGEWMDEFTVLIQLKKEHPENLEINKKMMEVSAKAKELQPELAEFMKDETFALIYHASIKRVTNVI